MTPLRLTSRDRARETKKKSAAALSLHSFRITGHICHLQSHHRQCPFHEPSVCSTSTALWEGTSLVTPGQGSRPQSIPDHGETRENEVVEATPCMLHPQCREKPPLIIYKKPTTNLNLQAVQAIPDQTPLSSQEWTAKVMNSISSFEHIIPTSFFPHLRGWGVQSCSTSHSKLALTRSLIDSIPTGHRAMCSSHCTHEPLPPPFVVRHSRQRNLHSTQTSASIASAFELCLNTLSSLSCFHFAG